MFLVDGWRRLTFAIGVKGALAQLIEQHIRTERGVNAWFEHPCGKIYMRVTFHIVDRSGRLTHCLDLSSIEIVEKHRRKGFFKVALKVFENTAIARNFEAVFVENVLNEDLLDYLFSQGYHRVEHDALSFYKRNARHVDPYNQ